MDSFVEQLVKKKKGGREIGILAALWLAAVVLVLVLALFLVQFIGMMLALVLAVLVCWGAWWLSGTQNIEFEYSITNGELDVDQIVAQRKRKRLLSVNASKAEMLSPYTAEIAARRFERVLMLAPSPEDATFCFTYRSKKYGNTLVVFMPDDRVLYAFYKGLQRLVQLDFEKRCREAGVTFDKTGAAEKRAEARIEAALNAWETASSAPTEDASAAGEPETSLTDAQETSLTDAQETPPADPAPPADPPAADQ